MAGATERSVKPSRLVALVISLITVLAGAACSSDKATVQLSAIGEATAKAESARVRMELDFDGATTTMEGVVQFASGNARIVSTGSESPSAGLVSVTLDGESYFGPIDPPKGGPAWLRRPKTASATTDTRSGFDPKGFVEDLKTSGAELTEKGHGEVHGDPTTVYDVHIDDTPAKPKAMFDAFGEANGTLEVGDDGLLRRFVMKPVHQNMKTPGSDQEFPNPSTMTFELWDYGVDVEVSIDKSRVVGVDDPAAEPLLKAMFGDLSDFGSAPVMQDVG
jgi:hypothetical protein